jgi:cyclopropane-fatty-acyl-phospholipid synthase
VTLSAEQHDFVKKRVAEENLEGQVQVHLIDYRDFEPGPGFDCLVSVEMIEAVGPHNFGQYFKRVRDMLKPGGRAVIQAITVPPKRFRDALYDVDFVKKYIFPGGACPSQELMEDLARKAGLVPGKVEEITSHYVTTLEQWRNNFVERLNEIKQLGYDNKFCRMMVYYFAYCEAGFSEGELEDIQAEYELPA